MADWKSLLERYLKFQECDILPDAGSVTHEEAEAKALGEYEKFWRIRRHFFSHTTKLQKNRFVELSAQGHCLFTPFIGKLGQQRNEDCT